MERGESAGNRQSFSLGLGDHEYQTHSSKWEVDDCTIVGNASFKKSRLDDVELQHREDDAHKSFPGDICQSRSISGSHRAKGQSFWDTVLCDDDHRSGFSRTSMTNEENPKQSPQTGFSGHFETAGFDFPQAGGYAGGHSSSSGSVASWEVENSSREVIPLAGIGSWSGVAAVSYTGMGCFMGGTQSDGKGMSNLVSSVDQSLENIKRKGFVLDDHDREVHRTTGVHVGQVDYEISKLRTGVEGGEYLDSSIHSISLSPSEVEGEEKSFHLGSFSCSSVTHSSNNRPDHGPEERRSSCKRKSLTTGLTDRSPFQGSQSSLWRETLPATTGGTGSMRSDSNGLSSSANFSITSNDPMIQIWDESSSDGIGITCNAKEYFEPLRVSNGKVSTPDETDGFPMTLQDQSISMPQEPSHSQLHSLFARNLSRSMPAPHSQNLSRSMPAPHSQNLFSRRVSFTEQQVGQSGENSSSIADDIDQWSTLFGERNSTSSVAATGDDINPSRRGNPVPRFIVRERASNVFEGSRMRGMSNRVSRVAGRALLDRSASRATSSQVLDGSTVRTTNSSETRVRTNQVANPFPNLGGASSALLSSSHRSGSINRNTPPLILPATVSGRPTLITSARQPRGSLAGLHSSGTRLPMFVDGRGEGIPEAPIQSILGLPFHGLHMLPADGEHRRRFLSEIISALEHAWRSEDINFQELVMLDPSLIYGGIDAHDQHSDMRLDVDNMSYEELLALEERIGDVSTGLSNEMISVCVRENKYSSLDATVAAMSQESDVKCSICQEEFVEEDELGRLDCGHGYHTLCIKQWLLQKNVCPVCKIPAYSKS